MLRLISLIIVSLLVSSPTLAQMNYGGSAAPSLELSLDITNDILRQEIGNRAANDGLPASQRSVGNGASAFVAGRSTAMPGLFGSALQPVDSAASVKTSFQRSPTLQKKSEAGILAEVRKRQPGAEREYARVLGQQDMAKLFDKAVRGYGLRNNDIADTMAAYWLVSWVIANDANDFSAAAARAVRDQVKGGIARTAVAGFSPEKKHLLADQAIFNTLIATQAFEYAQSGKISRADYRRMADVTQKAFLGFGADLRSLQLTDAGFVKR